VLVELQVICQDRKFGRGSSEVHRSLVCLYSRITSRLSLATSSLCHSVPRPFRPADTVCLGTRSAKRDVPICRAKTRQSECRAEVHLQQAIDLRGIASIPTMMHTNHLTTPAQALYRVFVQPAIGRGSRPAIQHALRRANGSHQHQPTHSKSFSTSSARLVKNRAPAVRKQLWDEQITSRLVYLLKPDTGNIFDPETGKPPEPVRRDVLLREMDRQTHRLVQVAPGLDLAARDASRGGGGSRDGLGEEQSMYRPNNLLGEDSENKGANWVDIPVCKVVSKKAEYEASSKRKEHAKEKRRITAVSSSVKTLELNWAIDSNDLGHRIERIQEFLGEGRKVEVVMAAKKKGRKASEEECEAALRRIKKAVGDVDGAKEVGVMEGKLGGFAVLRFQGRMPTATAKEA